MTDTYWQLISEELVIDYSDGGNYNEIKVLGTYKVKPTYDQLSAKITNTAIIHTLLTTHHRKASNKFDIDYKLIEKKFD